MLILFAYKRAVAIKKKGKTPVRSPKVISTSPHTRPLSKNNKGKPQLRALNDLYYICITLYLTKPAPNHIRTTYLHKCLQQEIGKVYIYIRRENYGNITQVEYGR